LIPFSPNTGDALMPDDTEFGLFDRTQETLITYDELPHWFQPNVAVFITFRTHDSMPRSAVLRMESELRDWLNRNCIIVNDSHPLPEWAELPTVLQQEYRQRKFRLWHGELDTCHGACVLKRPEFSQSVMKSLRYFDGERYDLDCAVIMPNHVHLIAQFRDGCTCTEQCVSWLRFTATQINRVLNRKGHFWQSEPFDHLIRSVEQFHYLRWYIQNNGPRAHLKPEDYRYWNRTME
ncbi:MAG: transposase, partial [Planctomyces sp.]